MSSVVISGDTSGAITLAAPSVAGTNTATLPAATGTVMVSGNMPLFSAYANTTQNLTTNVSTLVNFGAKEYDTATCYDTSTSKFTPTVAGYYQVSCAVNANTTVTRISLKILKNGTLAKQLTDAIATSIGAVEGSALIYCNGTTDYIQIYTIFTGVSPQIYGGSAATDVAFTYFQAVLVRSA